MVLADKAVTKAVASQFAPYFTNEIHHTIQHLRCYLNDACPAQV